MEKYLSQYSAAEIKEIVLPGVSGIINNPARLLVYPKFRGEITESKIDIETIESSPTFIRGTIAPASGMPGYKSEIAIRTDSADNEKTPPMLMYVFGYMVILIGFIIAVIHHPLSIWVYVITALCCLVPVVLVKLYSFFESTPPSPGRVKKEFLQRIKAVKI